MKQQTIKFLRGATTYASYDAAIEALNAQTHIVGQPIVALYNYTPEGSESSEVRLVYAVGKAAATGASSYEVFASQANLQELIDLVGDLSQALADHEDVLAGTDAGHAKTGGDLTFANGVGTVNNNAITLAKLQKIAKNTVLGYVGNDGAAATSEPVALTKSDLLSLLNVEDGAEVNQNAFSTVKVGSVNVASTVKEDTVEFEGGTNITLTGDATNKKITVAFDGTNAALTGVPTAPTAAVNTETTQIATTEFVVNEIENKMVAAQAMQFKGTVASASDLPVAADNPVPGWTYRASAAFTLNGENVEVGDMIICVTDAPTWSVIQNNIDGAVTGPASSVSGNLATFDGATGKVISDSGVSANNVVLKSTTVTGTNGLTGGGALSGNVTISHATATPTIGNGSVVTGVTADTYGHIATVSTTDLNVSKVDGDGAAFTPVAGKTYFVSGADFDSTTKTQLNVEYTELPSETGKVRVSSAGTPDYLNQKVQTGTAVPANNVYAVTVTETSDVLYLTTTIDVIDGGTF